MNQRGQTTVFAIGLMLVVAATAGIAVDGTRALLLRRTLQNAADSAARAGADRIDTSIYRTSGGRRILLNRAGAERAAIRVLEARGLDARGDVDVAARKVTVTMTASVPATFLALVGIARLPAAARAVARPLDGIP